MIFHVNVTVYVPDVEAETADDAINFVTETIEDGFDRPVTFGNAATIDFGQNDE